MAARRFGLRQRFILFIVSMFVVLFAAAATLLVTRSARSQRNTLNEQSKSFAILATKPISATFLLYKDSGQLRIQQQIAKFTDLDPDISGITVISTRGENLFHTGTSVKVTPEQAATFEPVYHYQHGTIDQAIVPVIEDFGTHRYAVVYRISAQRLTENIRRTVETIVLLSILTFAIAIVVTYRLIASLFLSAVSTISSKALRISGGAFEDQIELKRSDELGDLARAVNTMANALKADIVKLQEADKLKSEFIAIASHNLRTPLTTIKGNIELLSMTELPAEESKLLASLSAGAARLETFVEDILAISSMESGKLSGLDLAAAPLKPLLEATAANYQQVATQQGLQFSPTFDLDGEQVLMSKPRLKMALVNLLENAFKFTKQGSVEFAARVENGRAVITVKDTGIGVSAAELPKLFTKFHRGTSVMEYDYEGTGIGLYLTKLIVTDHHGTIEAASTEGQGTTFTVTLPLALPAASSATI